MGPGSAKIKGRIRVAKACERCKSKKTKCDGMAPCRSCVKHNLECVYAPSTYVKPSGETNEEDEPTVISAQTLTAAVDAANQAKTMAEKKQAIMDIKKPVIMAKLRDRITVLENDLNRLSNLIRTGDQRHFYSGRGQAELIGLVPYRPLLDGKEASGEDPPEAPDGHKTGNNIQRRDRPRKAQEENAGSMVYLCTDDTNTIKPYRPKMRYSRRYANSLAFKFGKELIKGLPADLVNQVKVPRMQHYGWNMSGGHYIKPRKIPPPVSLLDDPEARILLAYFFDKINPLHAILHKPMFMEQYDMCLLTPNKAQCRLFLALFHVVCAIAMRFMEICENAKFSDGLEEKLFDDAFATLQAFAFEWESVEIIQGFLLMAVYLRVCHRQTSAWSVLGTAIRMCTGMGLMHKPNAGTRLTDYEDLKRRRVFWACFVLDRTFCIEYGRHFSLREHDFSIPICPVYVDDGWQTKISHAFVQFCLTLGDLVYDRDFDLNSDEIIGVKARIMAWNDSMSDLGLGSDTDLDKFNLPPALVGHFRLSYYNSLFFIHMRQVFGLVGVQWDAPYIDRQLYAECVRGVTNVASTLSSLNQLKTPWWMSLCTLFHAGCIALLLIYHQIETVEMGTHLAKIIQLVTEIAQDGRFIMAKECLWSLKTLNHMVHMKLGQTLDLLKDIGLDHGSATINKGNFSSMGFLDSLGNEILPIGDDKKDEDTMPTPSNSTSGSASLQGAVPPNEALASSQQGSMFPGVSPMTDMSPEQINDPALSLNWFSSWDWEMGNSMAEYFSNNMGLVSEEGNEYMNGGSAMGGAVPKASFGGVDPSQFRQTF